MWLTFPKTITLDLRDINMRAEIWEWQCYASLELGAFKELYLRELEIGFNIGRDMNCYPASAERYEPAEESIIAPIKVGEINVPDEVVEIMKRLAKQRKEEDMVKEWFYKYVENASDSFCQN